MKRQRIEKIIDAEKIAAGEVVERPANIVKELIENSIDANAKEIRVIIKNAGKSLIHVIDDGIGIPPDEVEIAFQRHTSNKIKTVEDLDHLSTLGFRGEALASIAAVSEVEIISKTADHELGVSLSIKGGKVIEKKELACTIGTQVIVKKLFYNVPARLKFLKKDLTELAHITDILQRYALAYPNLQFIYLHNDLPILNCPASNDLRTMVYHIYGKRVADYMEPFSYEENKLKLHGLLGHSELARNNRTISSVFINKRYVISDVIFKAIQDAYKGVLMIGKFPFFILNIDLNPSHIDFNVHPKKLQIRFENEKYIYNKVYNVIRGFVEKFFIQKGTGTVDSDLLSYDNSTEKLEEIMESEDVLETIKDSFESTNENSTLEVNSDLENIQKAELGENSRSIQLNLLDGSSERMEKEKDYTESILREKYITKDNFPKVKLISKTGQLSNKTYIVLEGINENGEKGIFLLDQHAASERINKEYFSQLYNQTKRQKQQFISPLTLDLTPSETQFLQANLKKLIKLGFNFEHFGGNTFILREIPVIMEKIPKLEIIKDIIANITQIGKNEDFENVKEEIINYLACHKSIRGGDDLSLHDIRKLITNLANCNDSFHCAHGRPTLKFISFKEIDKLFKRIV
ncbi:MAG: DNA mismatch repair endonuclease MutL [Candidatus Hermodarchaeota archaeon]